MAKNLDFVKDESIDFVCTHPPYADIIKYSDGLEGDFSLLSYEGFLNAMEEVLFDMAANIIIRGVR